MQEREEQGAREQIEELEDRAEQMDDRSSELDRDIKGARSDWESKKREERSPGAQDEEGAADTSADELRDRRGEGSDASADELRDRRGEGSDASADESGDAQEESSGQERDSEQ